MPFSSNIEWSSALVASALIAARKLFPQYASVGARKRNLPIWTSLFELIEDTCRNRCRPDGNVRHSSSQNDLRQSLIVTDTDAKISHRESDETSPPRPASEHHATQGWHRGSDLGAGLRASNATLRSVVSAYHPRRQRCSTKTRHCKDSLQWRTGKGRPFQ